MDNKDIYGNQCGSDNAFTRSKAASVYVQSGDRRRGRIWANKSLQAEIWKHDKWG